MDIGKSNLHAYMRLPCVQLLTLCVASPLCSRRGARDWPLATAGIGIDASLLLGAQLVEAEGSCYTVGVCGLLAILFLVVPAVEIYVILKVGALLGVWATLAVIAFTAFAGAALAKRQGLAVLRTLSAAVAQGQGAGTAVVEGVLLLAAGVTLLAPGFITDAIGLGLLLPPVRRSLAKKLAEHWKLSTMAAVGEFNHAQPFDSNQQEPPPPGVIDV